jgi:hypothetical protein
MNWRDHAACRGVPNEVFYPSWGTSYAVARWYCGHCPVRSECLDAAMQEEAGKNRDHRCGMRGGLTGDERHKARFRMAAA